IRRFFVGLFSRKLALGQHVVRSLGFGCRHRSVKTARLQFHPTRSPPGGRGHDRFFVALVFARIQHDNVAVFRSRIPSSPTPNHSATTSQESRIHREIKCYGYRCTIPGHCAASRLGPAFTLARGQQTIKMEDREIDFLTAVGVFVHRRIHQFIQRLFRTHLHNSALRGTPSPQYQILMRRWSTQPKWALRTPRDYTARVLLLRKMPL
ncbi:hypothetical protein C8R45DRAFT_1037560, partial [Mycena sanguinolenta]